MPAQRGCATINYVLCSPHFDDIVMINPIDIDNCNINDINSNYTVPSKNEICNAYFKQLKHISKTGTT